MDESINIYMRNDDASHMEQPWLGQEFPVSDFSLIASIQMPSSSAALDDAWNWCQNGRRDGYPLWVDLPRVSLTELGRERSQIGLRGIAYGDVLERPGQAFMAISTGWVEVCLESVSDRHNLNHRIVYSVKNYFRVPESPRNPSKGGRERADIECIMAHLRANGFPDIKKNVHVHPYVNVGVSLVAQNDDAAIVVEVYYVNETQEQYRVKPLRNGNLTTDHACDFHNLVRVYAERDDTPDIVTGIIFTDGRVTLGASQLAEQYGLFTCNGNVAETVRAAATRLAAGNGHTGPT